MKVSSLFVVVLVFYANTLCAQDALPRKGSLGARIVNDSLSRGVRLQHVVSGGTAQAIGLQNGDIIHHLNQTQTNTISDLLPITRSFVAGQKVEAGIWRGSEELTLKGEVVAKPMEQSAIGEVIYGSVEVADGRLRTIWHKPEGDGPFPVIFYIQGYTCRSIDQYYTNSSPMLQLVNGLVNNGFAVCRVEKPGIGDSQNETPCDLIGYDEEIAFYTEAFDELVDQPFADRSRLFLFGHSLGGIAAPILANEKEVSGIIVYGTVLKSWFEYMVDIMRDQSYIMQEDLVTIENQTRQQIPLLYEYLINKKTIEQLSRDQALQDAINAGNLGINGEQVLNRYYTFWQELQDRDLTKYWSNVTCPVLAIYGEYDIQAIGPEDHRRIAELVNSRHPGNGTLHLLENTEHGFTYFPSMDEHLKVFRSGQFNLQYMAEHFNENLVSLIVDWLDES